MDNVEANINLTDELLLAIGCERVDIGVNSETLKMFTLSFNGILYIISKYTNIVYVPGATEPTKFTTFTKEEEEISIKIKSSTGKLITEVTKEDFLKVIGPLINKMTKILYS